MSLDGVPALPAWLGDSAALALFVLALAIACWPAVHRLLDAHRQRASSGIPGEGRGPRP